MVARGLLLKKNKKNYFSGFLCSLYLTSLTSVYLWSSCFTAYAANVNSKKENTISGLFAGTRVSSHGIAGFSEQWTAFTRAQSAILQSRNFQFLIHEANISKTGMVTLPFLMQKLIQQQERNACAEL